MPICGEGVIFFVIYTDSRKTGNLIVFTGKNIAMPEKAKTIAAQT